MNQAIEVLRNFVKTVYWKSPFIVFKFLLKARNAKDISPNIKFLSKQGKILVQETNGFDKHKLGIYIAKRTRLHLYFKGIRWRLNQISQQYMLQIIPDMKESSGWVIDIGANVGEFSLAFAEIDSSHNFLLIEPSKYEIQAAEKNLQSYSAFFCATALWNEEKELLFYHANETGDSSLLPADFSRPCEVINARTLDSLIAEFQISSIDILKVEAEGAEPEILEGATQALRITKYVTADLGPERGIGGLRTYDQCTAILVAAGFIEIAKFPGGRETYLFRNVNMNT